MTKKISLFSFQRKKRHENMTKWQTLQALYLLGLTGILYLFSCKSQVIADRFFSLKLFLQIIFCRQITSFWLMYCSNSRRLTSFFVPTNKTKGQLGERSILSILLMPMLLYSAASLAVSVILRWMGTVRMLSMEKSPHFCS